MRAIRRKHPFTIKTISIKKKDSGKRIKRGLYITKDKKQVNADINAASNILRKSKPNDNEEIHNLRDRGLTIPKRLQVIL